MSYISKELILKSYFVLSSLTEDHKQGQTQIVSAIRHFCAFDMFYKQFGSDCNLIDSNEKNLFIRNVRRLVSITGNYYTTNFYTAIKELEDCGVGSNFTSAGVVNNSRQNKTRVYDYPTRGQFPLFNVRNAVLIRNKSYYHNFKHYLSSGTMRAAFVIWVLRSENLSDLSFDAIREKLLSIFTAEFVNSIMPLKEDLLSFIEDSSVSEHKYEARCSDFFALFTDDIDNSVMSNKYRPYIAAIKSKPFLLLAGISGTGKSRIVRELARACWEQESEEYGNQRPRNFEMVQVKPNWHDSSELIGYVSRVTGKAEFVAGDFLKFVAKAWEEPDVPYFLCLDEMNLAPVEQYFAEYLSVVESRRRGSSGNVETDPILKKANEEWYFNLTASLTSDETIRQQFNEKGICLPANLIVVGTVNMDETTFSFSRKVLDRAMTIEMNDVDLYGGLTGRHEPIGKIGKAELVGEAVEGVDVYLDNKEVCDRVIDYLVRLNRELEGTPFKVAYRTRNEFLLYTVNNLPYAKDKDGNDLPQGYVMARALDEITSMKILSRIEGDDTKVTDNFLANLMKAIEEGLKEIAGEMSLDTSVSLAKLREMKQRLAAGYTSFWS